MSRSHPGNQGQAVRHKESSTRHHRAAELEYGSGDHKKAAHEAKVFHGNGTHASHHAEMVADEKVEHHGMDPVPPAENGAGDPTIDTPYATAASAGTADATGNSADPHDAKVNVADVPAAKAPRKRSPRRVAVSNSTEMGRGQE